MEFILGLELLQSVVICVVVYLLLRSSPPPQPGRLQAKPHRHVWVARSVEETQGKRYRISVCAHVGCPDRLREEVASDG